MTRRFRRAVLGGTFDGLHPGHRALIRAAFSAADSVRIGVTTESYLRAHPKPHAEWIASYRTRRRILGEYLAEAFPGRDWGIIPLNDAFGASVEAGPDLLVVSSSSLGGGRAVNRTRKSRGLPPLVLRVVPLVRDRSGRPYASRRRRALQPPRDRASATNR